MSTSAKRSSTATEFDEHPSWHFACDKSTRAITDALLLLSPSQILRALDDKKFTPLEKEHIARTCFDGETSPFDNLSIQPVPNYAVETIFAGFDARDICSLTGSELIGTGARGAFRCYVEWLSTTHVPFPLMDANPVVASVQLCKLAVLQRLFLDLNGLCNDSPEFAALDSMVVQLTNDDDVLCFASSKWRAQLPSRWLQVGTSTLFDCIIGHHASVTRCIPRSIFPVVRSLLRFCPDGIEPDLLPTHERIGCRVVWNLDIDSVEAILQLCKKMPARFLYKMAQSAAAGKDCRRHLPYIMFYADQIFHSLSLLLKVTRADLCSGAELDDASVAKITAGVRAGP